MKSNNRERGSFFSMVLKNYTGFTLTFAAVLLIGYGCTIWGYSYISRTPNVEALLAAARETEDYANLPVQKLLGKETYVWVLDEQDRPIAKSNYEKQMQFSKADIAVIPPYQKDQILDAQIVGEIPHQKILLTWLVFQNENQTTQAMRSMILRPETDSESARYILEYDTAKSEKQSYTQREFDLLTGSYSEQYDITKAQFASAQGKARTMLVFTKTVDYATLDRLYGLMQLALPLAFVFYALIAIVFGFWLNTKVKKPMTLLNQAMHEVTAGHRNEKIEYVGPREFVEICDSFNNMTQRLSESEKARKNLEAGKQKMLADISHDLKTPITVIQGFSKAICDGVVSPEKQPQYLNTIYQKATALTGLIDAFYEYSKLEHPDFAPVRQRADLSEFVREYLAGKYQEIEMAGFFLSFDLPEKPLVCELDTLQMQRALENIFVNMIKHNPPGTKIHVALFRQGKRAVLTLADTGVGISPKIADKIFEPFIVGDDSRNTKQGTGLGLSITRKIIEAHEGSVRLIMPPAAPYKTEFCITLPLEEDC